MTPNVNLHICICGVYLFPAYPPNRCSPRHEFSHLQLSRPPSPATPTPPTASYEQLRTCILLTNSPGEPPNHPLRFSRNRVPRLELVIALHKPIFHKQIDLMKKIKNGLWRSFITTTEFHVIWDLRLGRAVTHGVWGNLLQLAYLS